MRLGGFQAPQVRQVACTKGPICPEPLANNIVKLNVRHREAWFNGVIRALAQVRAFAATITGSVDATDLEPTAQYKGCGQVTRTRKMADKRGNVHEMEVAV